MDDREFPDEYLEYLRNQKLRRFMEKRLKVQPKGKLLIIRTPYPGRNWFEEAWRKANA